MGPVCRTFQTGTECAAMKGCGWSTALMGCRAGRTTSTHELTMHTPDEGDEGSNRAADNNCGQHKCGFDCSEVLYGFCVVQHP